MDILNHITQLGISCQNAVLMLVAKIDPYSPFSIENLFWFVHFLLYVYILKCTLIPACLPINNACLPINNAYLHAGT